MYTYFYDIYRVFKCDGEESEEYYNGGYTSIEDCKEDIKRFQSNEYRIYKIIKTRELVDTIYHLRESLNPSDQSSVNVFNNEYNSDDID